MMSFFYSRAFYVSLGLHLGLLVLMLWSPEHSQAVLEADEHSKVPMQMTKAPQVAPIQAVAVDAQEVREAMKKIEQQRQQAKQQELNHQRQLVREAEQAKAAKALEMKHLAELKKQADDLKVQQDKMKQEAALRLKKLEEQKKEQEKELAAMKQKQLAEAKKLEQMAKQRESEASQQQAIAKADAAKKAAQALAAKQTQELANQQRMAGEVDKYKALILNAIRDRWILPENIDPGLSSQFVIRLAPTGAVLDVRLTRSSGDSLLDRSAQAAIYKASPLPVPADVTAFNMFREISLTVRPSNARG
jgi:colicin import membrane protein